jgi:predicted SnoaL-like aldol condensation-catalyzing enzyme
MHRRLLLTGATLAGLTPPALTFLTPPALADDNTPQALAQRFATTLTAHDMTAFAALFGDNYVNHQSSAAAPPPPSGKTPKQASMDFFAARLAGIPDLQVSIEAMVASSDQVAASFVYSGTHNGPLFGVAPTGRKLHFTSCDIFLVRNGTFVEHWGMGDIAGVLAQLRS